MPPHRAHRLRLGLAAVHGACASCDSHGLLGPDQVHVHCNALADDELGMLAARAAAVSSTPETEMQMGMGRPVIRRWLDLGRRPAWAAT